MGSGPNLGVSKDLRNGVAKLALSGDLDLATRPLLDAELAEFADDGIATIIIDLRGLAFTDTTGIHAFQDAHDRATAQNQRLIVIGATPQVRRVFELTERRFLLDTEAAGTIDLFMGATSAEREDGPNDRLA